MLLDLSCGSLVQKTPKITHAPDSLNPRVRLPRPPPSAPTTTFPALEAAAAAATNPAAAADDAASTPPPPTLAAGAAGTAATGASAPAAPAPHRFLRGRPVAVVKGAAGVGAAPNLDAERMATFSGDGARAGGGG